MLPKRFSRNCGKYFKYVHTYALKFRNGLIHTSDDFCSAKSAPTNLICGLSNFTREFSFTLIARVLDEMKLILDKRLYSIQTKLRVFAWEISAQLVRNFMAIFNNAIFAAAPEVPLCTLSIAKQESLHRIG